jgi:hypothetical protein
MKKCLLRIAISSSLLASTFGSLNAYACGTKIPESEQNKGNYLCTSCNILDTDFYGETVGFIKNKVNENVYRWKPNDTVTITNGTLYATYTYAANGNFFATKTGNGKGPGTPVNHDGKGNSCDKNASLPNNRGDSPNSGSGGRTVAGNAGGANNGWSSGSMGQRDKFGRVDLE